jgi:hypothetical protein
MRFSGAILRPIIAATLLMCSTALAATTAAQLLEQDFRAVDEKIDRLIADGDPQCLVALAEEIHKEWRARSMYYYGELMLHICNALRSDFIRDNQPWVDWDALHSVAQWAVDTYSPDAEENISVETHYKLLLHLQAKTTYLKGSFTDQEWAEDRSVKAERWMVAWDRIEHVIDPEWGPEDAPAFNVEPPPGVLYADSGMPPEAIADPALRAQYVKAIEENERRRIRHIEQVQARRVKTGVVRYLTDFLAGTYAIPPYADAELEDILSRHVAEAELRQQILEAVAEKKVVNEYIRKLEEQNEALNRE